MLKRSCFVQKRHLDRTSSICKSIAFRLAFTPGSRVYSAKALPDARSSPTLQAFRLASKHTPPIGQTARDSFSTIPLNLQSVMSALASGRPRNEILQSIKQSSDAMSVFESRDTLEAVVLSLLQSSTPAYAVEILALACNLGCGLSLSVYETACSHLMAAKHWDAILDLVDDYGNSLNTMTVDLLNWRAKALLHTHQYSRLKGILHDFESAHLFPNSQTFYVMLEGFLRNHDPEGAQQCLKDMKKAGFFSGSAVHALVARHHRQLNPNSSNDARHNALLSYGSLSRKAQLYLANDLIQAALEAHDLGSAHRLLSLFNDVSVQALLPLTSSPGAAGDVSTLLLPAELPLHRLNPNGDTFVKFMNHLIRNSQPAHAIQLWKKASSHGIQATEGVIVSLVHALFLIGDGDGAIKMISNKSNIAHAQKLAELATGPWDSQLSVDVPQISLTIRISNALLRGLLRSRGLTCIPTLFDVMTANNIQPNEQTLSCVLRHMKKTNTTTPESLIQLLDEVSLSLKPSQSYFHHLFGFILRLDRRSNLGGAWSKANVSQDSATESIVRIEESYDPTAGLTLHESVPNSSGIRSLIQRLADNGVKCDGPMTALRILHDAVLLQDDSSAISTFKVLLDRGVRVTEHHFGALVEGYASSGDVGLALQAISTAERFGVKPNVVMYTSVISAYAKLRNPNGALQTFKAMIRAQIRPDVPCIDALVSSYFAIGEAAIARRLLISLWTFIQPFPSALSKASLPKLLRRFRYLHNKNE